MKKIPEDSAIATLRSSWPCWRQFIAECRRGGVIEKSLDYCLSNFADRIVAGPYTAFQLLEPEAQAWLSYFRQTGAIASAPAGEMEPVRKKQQTEDHRVWSEAVNDYVLL